MKSAVALLLAMMPLCAAAGPNDSIPDIELVRVAGGFDRPVHLVPAPGSGDLFVVEQAGVIRRMTRGADRHAVFLDIRDRVEAGGEKGLLGLAFHPDFPRNRRLFVNYTTKADGGLRTRVSEFTAAPGLGAADPASEQILVAFDQPYGNHNGGLVVFGPDGFLYIGTGDGGAANDPHNNGQRLDTLLGKLLRIDVDRRAPDRAYTIPDDNPFVERADARPEIFAYGLRNPWRFSFDRADGTIWCGDVGQNAREEICIVRKGENHGWRIMEGFLCTPKVNRNCETNGLAMPVVDYPRDEGVSVTGGYVYRGTRFPALDGVFLYGDFATGHYWGLRHGAGRVTAHRKLVSRGPPVASFGEDVDGELYVVGYDGVIYAVTAK